MKYKTVKPFVKWAGGKSKAKEQYIAQKICFLFILNKFKVLSTSLNI